MSFGRNVNEGARVFFLNRILFIFAWIRADHFRIIFHVIVKYLQLEDCFKVELSIEIDFKRMFVFFYQRCNRWNEEKYRICFIYGLCYRTSRWTSRMSLSIYFAYSVQWWNGEDQCFTSSSQSTISTDQTYDHKYLLWYSLRIWIYSNQEEKEMRTSESPKYEYDIVSMIDMELS